MRWCVLPFAFLITSLPGSAAIEETQGFFDMEVCHGVSPTWSMFVSHQSKVRDDDPAYFLWHAKIGIRHEWAPWLSSALAHRYEECRAGGDWVRESRSELDLTPRLQFGRLTVSDRNRIEYRDFDSSKVDRCRYRNELKVAVPVPIWHMTCYVSEEPQYDFEADRWSKHRLTAGLSRKATNWLKVSVYYRWDLVEQSLNHGEWDAVQIVGVKLIADTDRWCPP